MGVVDAGAKVLDDALELAQALEEFIVWRFARTTRCTAWGRKYAINVLFSAV